jgi:DNA-binding MarR family transcriptional regulator
VVLFLTPKGRALWRKVSSRYQANVDKIFGALPTPRRFAFINDLKVLHDSLLAEEGLAESGDRWNPHFAPTKGAA